MIFLFENFRFDTERCELFADGVLVHAEPQVCRLLELLVTNHGNVVSREQIQREIWGDRTVLPSAIDNRLRAVRSLLDDDGRTQRLIKTFPYEGYKFVGTVVEGSEREQGDSAHVSRLTIERNSGLPRRKPLAFAFSALAVLISAFLLVTFSLPFGSEANLVSPEPAEIPNSDPIIGVLPLRASTDGNIRTGRTIAYNVISELANVEGLGVVSAQSSFALDGRNLTSGELAVALGADLILGGLMSTDEKSVHLTVQLVASQKDEVVWSETYQASPSERSLLEFESDVARKITIAIANYLGEPVSNRAETLIDAKNFTLQRQALDLLHTSDASEIETAIAMFDELVQNEPTFVSAYMYYSEALYRAVVVAGWNRTNAIRTMKQLADKATELSPDSPETKFILGNIASLQKDSIAALGYYDAAIERNPNFALAYLNRGEMLRVTYRFSEAWPNFEKALTFDPLSSDLALRLSQTQFSAGQLDGAIRTAKQILLWEPQHLSTLIELGRFEMSIGNYASAMRYLDEAREINSKNFALQFNTLLLYNNLGFLDKLHNKIENRGIRATVAALQGDRETAYELIQNDPSGWISPYVQYLLGDSKEWYKNFSSVDIVGDLLARDTPMPIEQALDVVYLLDTFTKQNDPEAPAIRDKIGELFGAINADDLLILEEFSGVAGYYSLVEDYDRAFEIIEMANQKNMIFLGRLTTASVFQNLRQQPGYELALAKMIENRDAAFGEIQ